MRASSSGWETTFQFRDLRGLPVCWRGSDVVAGRLWDLVVILTANAFVVKNLMIRSGTVGAMWFLPWVDVSSLDKRRIHINPGSCATAPPMPAGPPVRVSRDLLWREIVDRDGRCVGKVRGARFALDGGRLILRDLDTGIVASLARAVGIRMAAPLGHFVPWHELASDAVGLERQPLRLRVSRPDLAR